MMGIQQVLYSARRGGFLSSMALFAGLSLLAVAQPSQAQVTIDGRYRSDGEICAAPPGGPGGMIEISRSTMKFDLVHCSFTSHDPVARVDAEMRDALCREGQAQPRQTRFIFAQTQAGLVIVSRAYGHMLAQRC